MPAAVRPAPPTASQAAQLAADPGACQVLNLVLGPIDLNLLGLACARTRSSSAIDAVPGAGNLLGNLLCAVTACSTRRARSAS